MAKSSDRMLLKQNAPRKELWRVYLVEIVAFLLLPKGSFREAHHETITNRMVESNFAKVKNRTIEADIMHNMVGNKTANGTVVSQLSKALHQNLAPLSRKFQEVILEESLTNVHPLKKNLLKGKIPNLQLAGRLAHLSKNWEKLTQDQEILSVGRGT